MSTPNLSSCPAMVSVRGFGSKDSEGLPRLLNDGLRAGKETTKGAKSDMRNSGNTCRSRRNQYGKEYYDPYSVHNMGMARMPLNRRLHSAGKPDDEREACPSLGQH